MHHRVLLACLLFAGLTAGHASAGPREDTLAGISRCAGNRDDRAYLDCIYGATQPLRASLGLVPALPNQLRLVPPAQSMTSASTPPPAPAPSQNSGFLGRMFGGSGPDLHMTAYSFDKRGLFTATLSNGEVWRQADNDTSFAHFGGRASDYSVSLTPSESGGAKMDVKGEPGIFTVQRLR